MKKLAAFLIVLATGAGFLMTAPAQAAPTAGKEYKVLPTPQPVPTGKVEVTEFFWYGCPHCYDFENTWTAWAAKQGKDVVIKRVPVAFNPKLEPHTRIYYTLEALGKLDAKDASGRTLHDRVFDQLHKNYRSMSEPDQIADFMAANGVDRKAFLDAYNSFGVNANTKRAAQLADQYKIEGVPTVVVQGKYTTSPADAGSNVGTAQTLDYLVQQVRDHKM
ncbi:thiol:disulfide interchange protein DsbA/DsbL [Ralstonia syzygii]|uniref:Thiol:disulfide interchange protein n=1 Tax=Ralstonia syzygii R24 TaxID=907261 RepID=G3A3V9_9RALS|nr:thiol:disulfide interchange protein DsbA/DsbL [Ralstonia syzygii]CCA88570.1 periplasmic protein disulfide isomerase I [Ralstonia syzygii R24]